MRVGVIGAGFTGLALAHRLSKEKHKVYIIESGDKPGGLAIGFKNNRWKWSLEKHYHHWFTNDYSILNLAKEVKHEVLTVRPKTSTYYNGSIYQIDSPLTLMRFNQLSIIDRLRTGVVLAGLKLNPFWKILENITARKFIVNTMGNKSWKVLWEPLFAKKFEKYYKTIAAVWFWARIKKRTPSLAYPKGGFLTFAEKLVSVASKNGAKFFFSESYEGFSETDKEFIVKTDKREIVVDRLIVTLPIPNNKIKMIGAVNLILELKRQFFKDSTYWLNVNEMGYPFLALVEHTNFISKKNYGNNHVLYIGNYLERNHPYFKMEEKELFDIYHPFLLKINPDFKRSSIKKMYLAKSDFAQPIVDKNYRKHIPKFTTETDGLYIANIQQVFPWDRGTNYAVEIAEKVAKMI